MGDEEFYDDDFIIYLTIEGTSHEDVMVRVTDPCKPIREQIKSIVQVFELPKVDNGGFPIPYLLGQIMDDEEEPKILDYVDEDGREQCLIDYNIQPGDHLHLISVTLCGTLPIKVEVRGTKMKHCVLEIYDGTLQNKNVGAFLKYIIETFHFPIFDNGYYIEYSLSIRERNRIIKCDAHKRLWDYIAIQIKNDTMPFGEFDLRMFLYTEQSKYKNRLGAFFEKWHLYCGQILYKIYKQKI